MTIVVASMLLAPFTVSLTLGWSSDLPPRTLSSDLERVMEANEPFTLSLDNKAEQRLLIAGDSGGLTSPLQRAEAVEVRRRLMHIAPGPLHKAEHPRQAEKMLCSAKWCWSVPLGNHSLQRSRKRLRVGTSPTLPMWAPTWSSSTQEEGGCQAPGFSSCCTGLPSPSPSSSALDPALCGEERQRL